VYRGVLGSVLEACFTFAEGQSLFAHALSSGTTKAFFALIAQFRTQDEPAYCGLASLIMVLNALQVDPQSKWKGVWRWYSEQSLSCCKPLEEIQKEGVSLSQVACLARCNALHVEEVPGVPAVSTGLLDEALSAGAAASKPLQGAHMIAQDAKSILDVLHSAADGAGVLQGMAGFRRAVAEVCASPAPLREAVIVNYNRGDLDQTGTGHFSPIGAYDEASDAVLVLDTARFKYPAHWVALPRLFLAACRSIDPQQSNAPCRGWLRLSRMAATPLLVFEMSPSLFEGQVAQPCATGCAGGTGGETCARWRSLLQEVHSEVRAALRGDGPCVGAASTAHTTHGAPATHCGAAGNGAALGEAVPAPVHALRFIAQHMHQSAHASPSARALGGLLTASTCSSCTSQAAAAAAPTQRKLSSAQAEDAQRLLAALEDTQMYKWVNLALGEAPPPHAGSNTQVSVSPAHSLGILLLAVCTPPSTLADLAWSSGAPATEEGKYTQKSLTTCCNTADAVWQQLQEASAADLSAGSSSTAARLLRSEVFMLQQQLAQAQPSQLPSSK